MMNNKKFLEMLKNIDDIKSDKEPDYDLKIKIKERQWYKLESKTLEFWRRLHKKYAIKALTEYSLNEDFIRLTENPAITHYLNYAEERSVLRLNSHKKRIQAEKDFKNNNSRCIEAKTQYYSESKTKFVMLSYELVSDIGDFKRQYINKIRFDIDELKKLRKRITKRGLLNTSNKSHYRQMISKAISKPKIGSFFFCKDF